METGANNAWARDIRRQVYELVSILVVLVVVAAGYEYWTHLSVEITSRRVNDYHLLTNSHYLRAMEELRNLQTHHGLRQQPADKSHSTDRNNDLILGDVRHSVLHYLADESIRSGLVLERSYQKARFTGLANKLEQQNLELSESYTAYEMQAGSDSELIDVTSRLLVTLEQMVRLHSITRKSELQRLHDREHLQDNIFYVLILLLLLVAILVARRSFVSIDHIIGEQISAEQKIKHQAHYDGLTGLPNRFLALDRLSQMIKEAERSNEKVAVLFIDLDRFKKINDTLGHASGDRLLVEAALRISDSVRAGDTVGRLGGDEFIVLIGGITNANEVMAVAENLIRRIGEVFVIDGKELLITGSIGISLFPDDSRDKNELISKADSAMYHSKDSGRNTFSYFTDSMNRNVTRQLAIEEQILNALDRGEFEVVYQQKVDLELNRIIGCEALLRWHNEALGSISPAEFIPVAEQTGLIVPIGEFVLNEALGRTREWQRIEPDLNIAVNVSPRQFRDPDLINKISRALHEYGIKSSDLELEITEGVLMSEYVHIDEALNELARLGVVIAMDDFGTGYSSLSYLRQYPFGVIKIDRSFIQDIVRNSMSLKLNHAAIAMAHALNIRVVAEGVETETQFRILHGMQCDVAQGYYFGKPVPAAQFTELLHSQRKTESAGSVIDLTERPEYTRRSPGSEN